MVDPITPIAPMDPETERQRAAQHDVVKEFQQVVRGLHVPRKFFDSDSFYGSSHSAAVQHQGAHR